MTEPTSVSDPRVGAVIQARYRILQRLASGGMGVVYRAERTEVGRPVAIKFLHPWIAADADFKRRFDIEVRAMSRLSHPCCASVIDFGEVEGAPFLVMEYVDGETLRSLLREGPLAAPRALDIARQILAGLAHAHERGIIHRDIKPENIVVEQATGLGDRVRILDFGVAKLTDSTSSTSAGFVIGTPSYMAPEQVAGGVADARTDVYAMGVLLFEMLAGKPPFEASDRNALLLQQRDTPAPRLRDSAPEVKASAQLEAAIARALEKDPASRWQTAAELAAGLAAAPEAQGQPTPVPQAAPLPPREPSAWSRRAAAVGAGVTVASRRAAGALTRRFRALPSRARWAAISAAALAGGAAALWLAWPASPARIDGPPGVESPAAEAARSEDVPGLNEAQRLAAAGRRESALAAFARLRREHPANARIPYLEGQVNFQNYRWLDGLESFRAAIANDPAYRSDPALIQGLIRCLDSDRFHAPCATFLENEIGAAALPQLEAARSHEFVNVRYRSQRLAERIRSRPR